MANTDLPADKRILQVAAELAETSDDNVAMVLLPLRDILKNYPLGTLKAAEVRKSLWKYDLIQVTALVLKQRFNDLVIAGKLSVILCKSCQGLLLDKDSGFSDQFLPNAVDSILTVMYQMSERYAVIRNVKEQEELVKSLQDTSIALSDLCLFHRFLCLNVLTSNRFLHLLMVEVKDMALTSMNLLIAVIKADRNAFCDLPETKLLSLIDELVFKISATSDVRIASTATRVLLFCLDYYPPLLDVLTSKRYKGLHAYLGKWKGKGFGMDISRLTGILEKNSVQQMEIMKLSVTATKIQAVYRGFKTRKTLRNASKALGRFQALYRLRKAREKEEEYARELKRTQVEIDTGRRRKEFLTSRRHQLKVIEKMPDVTVQYFMQNLQAEAAVKIQSAWRGYKARFINRVEIDSLRKRKAAIRIQRQVRRWMREKEARRVRAIGDLYPAGLNDTRRGQLQKVISNVREQFPVHSQSLEELKAHHLKAHGMLSSYYSGLPKNRKQDSHCYALMAQISVMSDQLIGITSLDKLSSEDTADLSYINASIAVAAKHQHVDLLKQMRQRWWEKTGEENNEISRDFGDHDLYSMENQF